MSGSPSHYVLYKDMSRFIHLVNRFLEKMAVLSRTTPRMHV
jgi:hypothetical protein